MTAGVRSLAETKIQRGIFPGDVLSPLQVIITMMPLYHTLRKCTVGYKLSSSQERFNHLMYMDDIQLSTKNEKELENLIHAVRILSGHRNGIWYKKCAMLVMKSGKRHLTDGMDQLRHDKIRSHGKNETYKYLGILEADTIQQVEMKDKIRNYISEKLECYSWQNYLAEILSKG